MSAVSPWSPWDYDEPYDCILMDPPWNEQGGGKSKRGADRHYPLVRTECMPELLIGSGTWCPARDAHLYMWVTNNYLKDGLWLMDVLGFDYVTNLVWVKISRTEERVLEAIGMLEGGLPAESAFAHMLVSGIGQYFRGQHELLLFGTRKGVSGTVLRTAQRDLGTVFFGARGEHSAKPPVARRLIERRTADPTPGAVTRRIEYFAREAAPGWDAWGNRL